MGETTEARTVKAEGEGFPASWEQLTAPGWPDPGPRTLQYAWKAAPDGGEGQDWVERQTPKSRRTANGDNARGVLRIDAPRWWVYATVHEPKCWEQVRGATDTGNLTRAPLFKENATAPSAARAQAPLARNL